MTGLVCDRCGRAAPRLVVTYWSDERWCPACCRWACTEFDRHGWPDR